MRGNRLNYEVVRSYQGYPILAETSTVDDFTWYCAYRHGYRPPNYPLPAIVRHVEIGISYVTVERSLYDYVVWWKDKTVVWLGNP